MDRGKADSGVANVVVAHVSSFVDCIVGTIEPVLDFFDVLGRLCINGVLDFSDLAVELIGDLDLGLSGLLFQVGDHVVKNSLHVGSCLFGVVLSHLGRLLVLLGHEIGPCALLVAEPLVNDLRVEAPFDDGFFKLVASLFHGLLEGGGLVLVVVVVVVVRVIVVVVVVVGLHVLVLVSALHAVVQIPEAIKIGHLQLLLELVEFVNSGVHPCGPLVSPDSLEADTIRVGVLGNEVNDFFTVPSLQRVDSVEVVLEVSKSVHVESGGVANVVVAHVSSFVDGVIGSVEPVLEFFDALGSLTVNGVLDISDLALKLIGDLDLSLSGLLFQVGNHVVENGLQVGSSFFDVGLGHLGRLLVVLGREVGPCALLGLDPLLNVILVEAPFFELVGSLVHGNLEVGLNFVVVITIPDFFMQVVAVLECILCFCQGFVELVHGVSLLLNLLGVGKSSILNGLGGGDTSDSGGGENFHLRVFLGIEKSIFIYYKQYDEFLIT